MSNFLTVHIEHLEEDWMDWLNISSAAKILSGTGFKVYMYLYMNEDKDIVFSPAYILEYFGVSPTSARRAFKELQAKNFLTEKNPNLFIFHSAPK